MPLNRTNIVLAVALAATVFIVMSTQVDYTQPNIEVLPDMKYTPAATAFAENNVFANGRTMQAPPPGAIARGHLPLHFQPGKDEAIRAGEELQNPYHQATATTKAASNSAAIISTDKDSTDKDSTDKDSTDKDSTDKDSTDKDSTDKDSTDKDSTDKAPTDKTATEGGSANNAASKAAQAEARAAEALKASVVRGGEAYRIFCVSCHGAQGAGDGPVPKRGFPPPPSLLTGKSRQMKDGQLFHILSYGQGSMTDFSGQLSHARRWDLVNFIRDLQASSKPPAAPADPADPETAEPSPETKQPDTKQPDVKQPDTEQPEVKQSDDKKSKNAPSSQPQPVPTGGPAKPKSGEPTPAKPSPSEPTPAKPEPAKPDTANPDPAKPEPAGANPGEPTPAEGQPKVEAGGAKSAEPNKTDADRTAPATTRKEEPS